MQNATSLERDDSLRIGDLAQRTGVTVETIRYYESLGLVEATRREASSRYRRFSPEHVERLNFVRRTKKLGFSLSEIRELLELGSQDGGRAVQVRNLVEVKLDDVRAKIRSLQSIESSLESLADSCDGRGSVRECAILQALETPAE